MKKHEHASYKDLKDFLAVKPPLFFRYGIFLVICLFLVALLYLNEIGLVSTTIKKIRSIF